MALYSLGKVAVPSAGTPVRATDNEADSTARFAVQSLTVEALAGNSGTYIYVGSEGLDRTTLEGVYARIAKGNSASLEVSLSPASINANDVYIDADASDDEALVSGTAQ